MGTGAPMRKILRITLGFLVLGVGLILAVPGIPGPGIVVIIVGLVILAEHFHWARRMLDWAKRKGEALRKRAGLGRTPEPPA